MKRPLFNLAAGASLLLCVAIVVSLWRAASVIRVRSDGSNVGVAISDGSLVFYRRAPDGPSKPRWICVWRATLGHAPAWKHFVRLVVQSAPDFTIVMVPLWPGILVTSFVAWRCRRRGGRFICATCGYDLRATPGRCPECGHVPADKGDVGGARRQGLE